MRSCSIQKFLTGLCAVLMALCLVAPSSAVAAAPGGINTEAALRKLIENAKDGDVLLVDNITFASVSDPVTVDKSITFRSYKEQDPAVWNGASFVLDGSAGKISVAFENITFCSDGDAAAIMDAFWDSSSRLPSAMTMQGNVDAQLSSCVFRNYVSDEGANIRAVYDDTGAQLSLSAKNCSFLGNAVCLRGGAVLLVGSEGQDNIRFTAQDCAFTGNMSSNRPDALGGGAVYAENAVLELTRCSFISNEASHQYLPAEPEETGAEAADPEAGPEDETAAQSPESFSDYTDTTGGGAICAVRSSLLMNGCDVCLNSASLGGAFALTNSRLDFLNGIVARNHAESSVLQEGLEEGLAAGTGMGGGLYITADESVSANFINSSFYGNSAFNAYGGLALAGAGEGSQPYTVNFTLCTYADNTVDTAYDKPEPERGEDISDEDYEKAVEDAMAEAAWVSLPGNIWSTQLVRAQASLVIDESFSSLKRNRVAYPFYELPSLINNYVYYAAPENALVDGYMPNVPAADFTQVAATKAYCEAFPLEAGLAEKAFSPYYDEVLGDFLPAVNSSGGLEVRLSVDGALWQVIDGDGTVPELPVPEKEGYHFDAWLNADGSPYVSGASYITGPERQTREAVTTLQPNSYMLHFTSEAGTEDIPQVYGEPVTLPVASEKKDYDFVRWYKSDGSPAVDGEIYTVLGDSSFTAQYTKQFPMKTVTILSAAIALIVLYLIIARIVDASKKAKARRKAKAAEEAASAQAEKARQKAEKAKKKAEEEAAQKAGEGSPIKPEEETVPKTEEAAQTSPEAALTQAAAGESQTAPGDAVKEAAEAEAEPPFAGANAEAENPFAGAAARVEAALLEDVEDGADDLSAALRLESAAASEAAAAEKALKDLAEIMAEDAQQAAENLPKESDPESILKAFAEAAAEAEGLHTD